MQNWAIANLGRGRISSYIHLRESAISHRDGPLTVSAGPLRMLFPKFLHAPVHPRYRRILLPKLHWPSLWLRVPSDGPSGCVLLVVRQPDVACIARRATKSVLARRRSHLPQDDHRWASPQSGPLSLQRQKRRDTVRCRFSAAAKRGSLRPGEDFNWPQASTYPGRGRTGSDSTDSRQNTCDGPKAIAAPQCRTSDKAIPARPRIPRKPGQLRHDFD